MHRTPETSPPSSAGAFIAPIEQTQLQRPPLTGPGASDAINPPACQRRGRGDSPTHPAAAHHDLARASRPKPMKQARHASAPATGASA